MKLLSLLGVAFASLSSSLNSINFYSDLHQKNAIVNSSYSDNILNLEINGTFNDFGMIYTVGATTDEYLCGGIGISFSDMSTFSCTNIIRSSFNGLIKDFVVTNYTDNSFNADFILCLACKHNYNGNFYNNLYWTIISRFSTYDYSIVNFSDYHLFESLSSYSYYGTYSPYLLEDGNNTTQYQLGTLRATSTNKSLNNVGYSAPVTSVNGAPYTFGLVYPLAVAFRPFNSTGYGCVMTTADKLLSFSIALSLGSTSSVGYDDGYQNGYDNGYQNGYDVGESNGYDNGYSVGHVDGERVGYNAGIQVSSYSFMDLFGAIADTPILMIRSLFNFDVFGTNLLVVVMSLFTAVILFYLLRKLL